MSLLTNPQIWKVFQHILLQPVIIRMQPHTDICLVSQSQWTVGDSVRFSLGTCFRLWLGHLIHFISYQIYFIHLYSVSAPSTAANGYKDATLTWYWYAGSHSLSGDSWRFCRVLTCSVFYIMIETLHPVDTHSKSTSYIYNVFQHLLLLPVVIRKQPQPDICSLRAVESAVRDFLGFSLVVCFTLWLRHCTHFILIADLLHTCIICFSTFCCAQWSKGWNPTLISSLRARGEGCEILDNEL